jgi:hypothetical protein
VDVTRRATIRSVAEEWAERTALEQGFPAFVEDEAILQTVASLLCAGRDASQLGQARQAGVTRLGSNRFRPRTAGPTSA